MQSIADFTTNPTMVHLPDNYNINELSGNGWWETWSMDKSVSGAPADGIGRIVVHQQIIKDPNNIWLRTQTAYEWYYSANIDMMPRIWRRWIYLRPDGYLWTKWKEL